MMLNEELEEPSSTNVENNQNWTTEKKEASHIEIISESHVVWEFAVQTP